MNPIHAAGVFRRFGSGGDVIAALTIEVKSGEQSVVITTYFIRSMVKGYRTCIIVVNHVILNHWEHLEIDKSLLSLKIGSSYRSEYP